MEYKFTPFSALQFLSVSKRGSEYSLTCRPLNQACLAEIRGESYIATNSETMTDGIIPAAYSTCHDCPLFSRANNHQ